MSRGRGRYKQMQVQMCAGELADVNRCKCEQVQV